MPSSKYCRKCELYSCPERSTSVIGCQLFPRRSRRVFNRGSCQHSPVATLLYQRWKSSYFASSLHCIRCRGWLFPWRYGYISISSHYQVCSDQTDWISQNILKTKIRRAKGVNWISFIQIWKVSSTISGSKRRSQQL